MWSSHAHFADVIFCHWMCAGSNLHAWRLSYPVDMIDEQSAAFSSGLRGCQSCGRQADKCPPLLHFGNCTFACFEYPRAKLFRGKNVCWCAATYLLNMMFYPVTAGPGPGRYGLPPTIGFVGHDYTKSTSPAYSFHGRMTDTSKFFSYFALKLTGGQNPNKNACWFWQMAKNNTR